MVDCLGIALLTQLQIETLPTRSKTDQALQNVLSISTAGKNRYLLHFNSLHSLTQWTAGIRLAMFEHASLQELYTGSLIAGKGKGLNNIKVILERSRMKTEDWVRVRFGAGTPWRRCWCVISPPDEKDFQKLQKQLRKKSAYDRSVPVLKGDIKFYDGKRTKKAVPIATITDAYSAYAIYPQSKPLIDQSTLVKVEGTITIHSQPASTTEGFVFVMPEAHPAVSGFEMMLRWIFPVFDTFALYGRPTKLIADTLDVRGLMFAMPQERRYGYLEILDVAGLIHTDGSHKWREADWRKKLKELTAKRIASMSSSGSRRSRVGTRHGARSSLNLPPRSNGPQFDDSSTRSSPTKNTFPLSNDTPVQSPPLKAGSAPPTGGPFPSHHQRSVSEAQGLDRYNVSNEGSDAPPLPPPHGVDLAALENERRGNHWSDSNDGANDRSSSDSDIQIRPRRASISELPTATPPDPVAAPPAFARRSSSVALPRPYHSPELRRANSRMSTDTLSQLAGASGIAAAGAAAAWKASQDGMKRNSRQGQDLYERPEGGPFRGQDMDVNRPFPGQDAFTTNQDGAQRGVIADTSNRRPTADYHDNREGLVPSGSSSGLGYHPLPNPPTESDNLYPQSRPEIGPGQSQPRYDQSSPLQATRHGDSQMDSNIAASSQSQANNASPKRPRRKDSLPSNTYGVPAEDRAAPGALALDDDTSRQPGTNRGQKPSEPLRLQTSQSIARKPLPNRSQTPASAVSDSPKTTASLDSLRNHMYDQTELDQVLARLPTHASGRDATAIERQGSYDSSVYDLDSEGTPDYASTRKSTETKRSAASMDRPRAGVMRTVGTVEPVQKEVVVGDIHYKPDNQPQTVEADIPEIDFGPTYDLASNARPRPSTPGTMMASTHEKTKSADLGGLTLGSNSPSSKTESPARGAERSLSVDNSPGPSQDMPRHSRPPSRTLTTPEFERTRNGSTGSDPDVRRSVAWSPAMAPGVGGTGSPNRRSITPEQFVQQRASQARVSPVFAHHRKHSGNMLRSETPPMLRNATGDYSPSHSPNAQGRVPYGESLPRPPSRGASMIFNSAGDYSAHLSAREQEQVARVTGSPLVNMGPGPARHQSQGGLIGAIEAREREKKEAKEGLSGQMVQHAINQRRQQEAQAYALGQQQYAPSTYAASQMNYAQPSQQYPVSNYAGSMANFSQPQQQQWNAQAGQMPAGWSPPRVDYYQSQEPGHQYPPQNQQQQQQFGPYLPQSQQNRRSQGF